MKRNCGLFVFGLLMISEYGQAQSLWTAIDEVDQFTDEGIKAAVYEDDTHRIQISVETEKTIAMYLSSKGGTFEPNTKLEMRIDKNPMVDFEPMGEMLDKIMTETLGMPLYRWTPTTLVIMFASIDGLTSTAPADIETASNSCSSIITQFLNGKNLIGRYYVSDTSRENFSISLEGFKEAANKLFEIRELDNDNPHCLR